MKTVYRASACLLDVPQKQNATKTGVNSIFSLVDSHFVNGRGARTYPGIRKNFDIYDLVGRVAYIIHS